MKARAIISAALAAALGLGAVSSFAQDWGGRGQRDGRDRQWTGHVDGDRHDGRSGWQRPAQQVNPPAVQYQQHRQYRPNNYVYSQPGYAYSTAPRASWQRGQRLPYGWHNRMAVVNDWRAYNLYAPPAGYTWVQGDGGDYLLVALATGLIANLLLNHY